MKQSHESDKKNELTVEKNTIKSREKFKTNHCGLVYLEVNIVSIARSTYIINYLILI